MRKLEIFEHISLDSVMHSSAEDDFAGQKCPGASRQRHRVYGIGVRSTAWQRRCEPACLSDSWQLPLLSVRQYQCAKPNAINRLAGRNCNVYENAHASRQCSAVARNRSATSMVAVSAYQTH
jgi:hypothetical protein